MRTVALGASALLVLAGATACGPSARKADNGGASYVAMGDSYTAAPYLGEADGADGCVRSLENYPHLLAEKAGLDLHDVSCTSASTLAITGSQVTKQGTLPPQVDAVGKDTDLVTIGIGFNDFGMSARLFGACPALTASQPTAVAPCTAADQTAGAAGVDPSLAQLPDRLRKVVEAVKDRAPKARVLLVGYPSIFPEDQPCAVLPVAAGDLALLHHVVDTVNAAISSVADDLDATYVDTTAATDGHDMCAEDPWIAGSTNDKARGASPWHPYREEQQAVADLLEEAIR